MAATSSLSRAVCGLGNRRAGGLEAGHGPGHLGLVAEGGRKDHPLGDLDRQLGFDVDRLAVVFQEDLVPGVELALAENAVLGEQARPTWARPGREGVDGGRRLGRPRLSASVCQSSL